MKKIVALLLAAVMCLSLVACGSGETPNTNDNSGMQQETESNNAPENNDTTANETSTPTITFGVGDSQYADHPYLSDIFGTWEYEKHFYDSEYTLYKSLVLNEDGSCTIDGVDANWKLDDENTNDNYLYIGIYSNSEIIYAACFRMDTTYGFCMVPMSSLWAEPDGAVFTKK